MACENQYRTTIASKAALIVVDDVWSKTDIEPLLAESPRSRFLFTTRDAAIGRFVGAHEHQAGCLIRRKPRSEGEIPMPKVKANNITMNYDQQGTGEPLVLIPYLAADHACYAFQVAEYAKHFTCISLDLRGTGETDKPEGAYSTELLADDVAAFMQAVGIQKAHISGLSLGAAIGMWLAAKYPDKVQSLSLHSGWPKTDPFIKTVVEGWQVVAKAVESVPEMVILAIFPWCFTPELYATKPDYIQSLADFVRSRPAQSLASFHPAIECRDRP